MSNLKYFDLSTRAPARMAMMRRDFENHPKKYPHCPESYKPKTWRDIRAYTFSSYMAAFCHGLNPGFDGIDAHKTPVYYCHTGPQFRGERYADDVLSNNARGYHTETDARDVKRGIVARLTHGRFIAGYEWSANNERVYYLDVFADEREAARMGDEHARVSAELDFEYSEKMDAARNIQSDIEECENRLNECLALRNNPKFCNLRNTAGRLIADIREKRETLKTEYNGVDYA
jgi:hypothetical protein